MEGCSALIMASVTTFRTAFTTVSSKRNEKKHQGTVILNRPASDGQTQPPPALDEYFKCNRKTMTHNNMSFHVFSIGALSIKTLTWSGGALNMDFHLRVKLR